MPSRDLQLHFCQSLVGLSNEGSVDPGDPATSTNYLITWLVGFVKKTLQKQGYSLDWAAHFQPVGIHQCRKLPIKKGVDIGNPPRSVICDHFLPTSINNCVHFKDRRGRYAVLAIKRLFWRKYSPYKY